MAALAHLRHIGRREADAEVGHNAAGGWMVLALLGLLCAQVATGLCANDDVLTQGPLADWVGKANSDWLSGLHARIFLVIEVAVGLHVLAVLVYAVLKRQDLVRPMLGGWKRLPEGGAGAGPALAGAGGGGAGDGGGGGMVGGGVARTLWQGPDSRVFPGTLEPSRPDPPNAAFA